MSDAAVELERRLADRTELGGSVLDRRLAAEGSLRGSVALE